jgi:hypothetical protein
MSEDMPCCAGSIAPTQSDGCATLRCLQLCGLCAFPDMSPIHSLVGCGVILSLLTHGVSRGVENRATPLLCAAFKRLLCCRLLTTPGSLVQGVQQALISAVTRVAHSWLRVWLALVKTVLRLLVLDGACGAAMCSALLRDWCSWRRCSQNGLLG